MRKVTRSVHEAARDVARAVNATPAFEQSRRERKKVEMLFAHLKRILKLDRLRLRGPFGAHAIRTCERPSLAPPNPQMQPTGRVGAQSRVGAAPRKIGQRQ